MARKMKSPHPFIEVPDFKTAREMIEYGHIKGGDQKQYVYLETRTKERTKSFNEVWYDTVGLGQNLYMRGLSGKKVAILSDNSYYWIVCFYSILTGKYTVIPLDAKLMDDDIIDIMRRSHCDAIYYSDEFAGTVEKLKKADGVCLKEYIKISDFYDLIEEGHADIKAGNKCYLDEPPLPEDIATIVFTSGTTGKSKGVMLSHKNIMTSAVSSARLIQGHHAIGFLPMNHTFAWASALFLVNVFTGWGYICRSLKDIPQDMKSLVPDDVYFRTKDGIPLDDTVSFSFCGDGDRSVNIVTSKKRNDDQSALEYQSTDGEMFSAGMRVRGVYAEVFAYGLTAEECESLMKSLR